MNEACSLIVVVWGPALVCCDGLCWYGGTSAEEMHETVETRVVQG